MARNFGKERCGVLYQCIPYRMEDSDDIFWYDIAVHTVSDFTLMSGVRYIMKKNVYNSNKDGYRLI